MYYIVPLRIEGPVLLNNSTLNVSYGHSLTLGCWVRGYPLPPTEIERLTRTLSVKERKSGESKVTLEKTSRLESATVKSVTVGNSGQYQCTLTLLNGTVRMSSSDTLSVNGQNLFQLLRVNNCNLFSPAVGPYFVQDVSNLGFKEFSQAILRCTAKAAPPPTITWVFNSSFIGVGETIQIQVETSNFRTTSVLKLSNVTRADVGFYSCVASNGIGQDIASKAAFMDVYCMFFVILLF